MNGLLAVVLLATIIQGVLPRRRARRWHPVWRGGPLGVFSGLLAGAYGTGGPPLVAYIYSRTMPRHRHVVSIQVLLLVAGTIRVVTLLWHQSLTPWQWTLNGVGACFSLAGAIVGVSLLNRMPDRLLRRLVLLLLAGVMLYALHQSVSPPRLSGP